MTNANPAVDPYFEVGCGRCPRYNTPDCSVKAWPEVLARLRTILLDTELTEELKWSVPCYTFDNSNVLIMHAFKDYCVLSFFKGVLLKDPHDILIQPTQNMQAGRQIRFTDVQDVVALEPILKAYVQEAIDVEKAGLKVAFKQTSDFDVPEEFQRKLDEDPALKAAFEALTPGRQRGYLLHFSQAKQSRTRAARVERCIPKIFEGKGFHDR